MQRLVKVPRPNRAVNVADELQLAREIDFIESLTIDSPYLEGKLCVLAQVSVRGNESQMSRRDMEMFWAPADQRRLAINLRTRRRPVSLYEP